MEPTFHDRGCGRRRPFMLRVMRSDGCWCPTHAFTAENAIYRPSDSLVYTAVLSEESLEYWGVKELPWADIAEIRLWGALTFSVPEGNGYCDLYPLEEDHLQPIVIWADRIDAERFDRIAARYARRFPPQSHRLHWHRPDAEEVAALYDALKAADNVLLRGVNCYLKAQMLSKHRRFVEEMGINLYIALEAGLKVLHRQLCEQAGQSVPFDAVFQHIRETFAYGDALAEFWIDARDDRNIVVHPDCYLGPEVMHPPYADDLMELFGPMLSLYRYIMLGIPRPDYLAERRASQARTLAERDHAQE